MSSPTILVSAAVLYRGSTVLLSQRKKGSHLADLWEFPGGKVEPREDPRHALARELDEELGIAVTVGDVVEATFHCYADVDKAILLLFFEVTLAEGSPEPYAKDVAAVKWATAEELDPARFPAADGPVLAKVRARLARAMA